MTVTVAQSAIVLYLCSTWLYLCSTSALPGFTSVLCSIWLYLCSTGTSALTNLRTLLLQLQAR